MKKIAILFGFLIYIPLSFCQQNFSGQVIDKKTLDHIEFVNVFNQKNYTITNQDGKFDFNSSLDSINFKILGYETLKTSFVNLPKNGIIHLEPKTFELDEVIITNENTSFKKMFKTIEDQTPMGFHEEFFLRTVLKKNDSILKIQDLNGVVHRKVLIATDENPIEKKNYTVYINQMRKAGYAEKNIYFEFFSFNQLLTELVRVRVSPKSYIFKKKYVKGTNLLQVDFAPKSAKNNFRGYYLIDSLDHSLRKVFWTRELNKPFQKNGPLKFRTTKHDLNVNFFKSEKNNQYRIKNAKKNVTVECYYKENQKIIYDVTFIYKTKAHQKNTPIANKVSTKKDIFKIKHPFNKAYWNNNPHLKLTDEMFNFIEFLEKSALKTVTNFKK